MEKIFMLVTFRDNWADEMDLEGFFICSKEEFILQLKRAKYVFEKLDKGELLDWRKRPMGTLTYHVGSNEEIEYESFEQFERVFSAREMTELEADVVKKFFGSYHGHGANLFYDKISENLSDEELKQLPESDNIIN